VLAQGSKSKYTKGGTAALFDISLPIKGISAANPSLM
jgi:hypothetical protein